MPYTSSEPTRPLEFPLYNSADVPAEQPEDTDANQIAWTNPDSDERVFVVLNLSLNEYIALASAIDVGRDIAYPADSHRIWWIWIRSFVTMDLCTYLQDCLGTQLTALQDGLDAANLNIEQLLQFAQRNEGALTAQQPAGATQASCDEPRVQSGALAVVEWMVDLIIDTMEIAEVSQAGSDVEEYAAIIGAIPVFETLPIDDMFSFVDWMFENQQQAFEAAVTQTWKEQAADDLHCIVMGDNCTLTANGLTRWFLALRDEYSGNIAADIFTRFGEATSPSLANQVNQFLNQFLNDRDQGTIFDMYEKLIRAYQIGLQNENYTYTSCAGCETTNQPAIPQPDEWVINTFDHIYSNSWMQIAAPHTIAIDVLSVREFTKVRVFWWTQYNPTETWECWIDSGTPETLVKTWGGWGVPNTAEIEFSTPQTGETIHLSLPNPSLVAVLWVEWDSCPI